MFTLRQSLRTFPRAFWILTGATFVNKFGVFVVPFLTIFVTRKGFSAAEAGLAAGAYPVGSFGAAMLGGWLADRIGRNATMAFASLGGAACMLCLSQAEALEWLVMFSFLTGLVNESGNSAGNALVQDMIPAEHRMNAFTVMRFATNLGWSFGPGVAGLIAKHSFFWLFAGDAATSLVFGLVALWFLPRGSLTPRERTGWPVALRHIFTNRAFLALAAAQIFLAFDFRQITTSFALHLERSGHSLDFYGAIQMLNGIMVCTLELALLTLTRGGSTRGLLALGYVVLGSSYLILLAGSGQVHFFAVMAVFTIGEMFAFARQPAYVASLAHDEMRGRYHGFLSLAWCIGSSSSAALGMRFYDVHPDATWCLCAVFGLMAAACVLGRKARMDGNVHE